ARDPTHAAARLRDPRRPLQSHPPAPGSTGAAPLSASSSFDRDEIDVEHQRRTRRYRTRATVAIGEIRRDRQSAPAADLHALNALVPTLDDLAAAEREAEWRAAGQR